jgi:hypothetical protein
MLTVNRWLRCSSSTSPLGCRRVFSTVSSSVLLELAAGRRDLAHEFTGWWTGV